MRRVLHLSDLHFGRTSPHLPGPLKALADRLRPDLTVISGDLTQRARNRQFAEAAAFIRALPGPVLCVPGNHDVPLDNPFLRVLAPFSRYRRHIATDLEPVHEDEAMIVAGVNTVNLLAVRQGRIAVETWTAGDDFVFLSTSVRHFRTEGAAWTPHLPRVTEALSPRASRGAQF